MRLFRDEEAARKAGLQIIAVAHDGLHAYCRSERDPIQFLTPRERALLEALETLTAGVADKLTGVPEAVDGYRDACNLLNSLNVEG